MEPLRWDGGVVEVDRWWAAGDAVPVDVALVGGRALPLTLRAEVAWDAGADPVILVVGPLGPGSLAIDGVVAGAWDGVYRSVVSIPVPRDAAADGRAALELRFDENPAAWPAFGALVDDVWVAPASAVPWVTPDLRPVAAAGATAESMVLLAGVVNVWLGARTRDGLPAEVGAALVLVGATGLWTDGWLLGLLPALPGHFLLIGAVRGVGLWLLARALLGLLAPDWRRARTWLAPALGAGTVLADAVPAPFAATYAALGVTLVATIVHAARRRAPATLPVAASLVPGAVSVVLSGLGRLQGTTGPLDLLLYVVAIVALPIGLMGGLAARFQRTREAADRFVPREYLAAIGAADLADAAPGVRVERTLSILFTDIRGFTALSEGRTPAEVAAVVDAVLAAQAEVVVAAGGFVDKYVGDALMALFPDGTDAAAAAVACVAAVDALGLPVSIGAGVHRGPVQVGVVGSSRRLACTALGDAVNLASRVEGHTRTLGVGALATDEVAPGAVPAREVGRVVVKGRAAPVALRELGRPAPAGWDGAMGLVAARRHADAAAAFAAWPDDPVARVWVERCRAAPADWDGVTHLTGK